MVHLKWLLFSLTFCEFIFHSDAMKCPKGQRVSYRRTDCESCPDGLYQPEVTTSLKCRICTKCDEESGSFVKEHCTKVTNTKCGCRDGFVESDSDFSTCKCDKGFGKTPTGGCLKCEDGYFNKDINSPCKKWKSCKTGVNITGTSTTDVICNDESKAYVSVDPTSNRDVSLSTRSTTKSSQEGAETKGKDSTHSSFVTLSAPGRRTTHEQKVHPTHPSNTANHIGIVLLAFVTAFVVLTAVICKLSISPRQERKPALQTQDSLCHRPVEESGDDSLSSLKQNPAEP